MESKSPNNSIAHDPGATRLIASIDPLPQQRQAAFKSLRCSGGSRSHSPQTKVLCCAEPLPANEAWKTGTIPMLATNWPCRLAVTSSIIGKKVL